MSVLSYQEGVWQNLATAPTSATLTNSTTETDIITGTLPAAALGPNGRLKVFAHFQPTNRTGSTQTLTLQLKSTPSGGSVHSLIAVKVDIPAIANPAYVNRGLIVAEVININDPTQQAYGVQLGVSQQPGPGNSLVEILSHAYSGGIVADIDTDTVSNDFRLTFTMGVADSGYSVTYAPAYAERIYIS